MTTVTATFIVSDLEIITHLSKDIPHPFVSNQHGQLNLEPLLQRHQHQLHKAYLRRRDEYKLQQTSAASSRSPTWVGTSFAISHHLFKRISGGARRAQIQRILYDWHYTGRNRFKASENTADLVCQCCLALQEDQHHIMCSCHHDEMTSLRDEHWQALNEHANQQISKIHDSALANATVLLHDILSRQENYSMLIGRIHPQQRHLLTALPQLTASELKQLLVTWSNYAAMVVDLYTQRQSIIQNNQSRLPRAYKFFVGKRVIAAREVLLGIDPTTFIYADGTKVKTTKYAKSEIMQAHQRHMLTATNSQLLRTPVPKLTIPTVHSTSRPPPLQLHIPTNHRSTPTTIITTTHRQTARITRKQQ